MNMFKKNGGFTLVELIVVIAILAILAGVAVPAYTGYMTRAKDSADITALDAVKTAAMATVANTGALNSLEVTSSTVKANGTEIHTNTDFLLFYTGATTNSFSLTFQGETYKNGAVWNATASGNIPAGWSAK